MRAARLALALGPMAVLGLGAGGCLRSTAYSCSTDEQCVRAGERGTCEAVGYCAFADDGCTSGRRYGEGAGAYSDACVGDERVDAAAIDGRTDGPPGDGRDAATIDARTDAAVDAATDAPIDAAPVGCLDPGNGTTFPNGPPCAGWGTPFGSNVTVQQVGGRLTVTPAAGLVANGGCAHAAVPFAAPGALVEVERTVEGANGRTRLELQGTGWSIGAEGGMMVARANDGVVAMVPYSALAMRFWRLRPAGTGVVYETSPDALGWTAFASSPLAPPASAPIRVVGETVAAEAAPGSARFQSLNVCP